jgi:hypothetical protein
MNLEKSTNLEFQCVLNRWKNFFNQVLNVHGVHDLGLLVPEPSLVKVKTATGKLKSINPWVLMRFWPN